MPYAPGVQYNPNPIGQGLAGGMADIANAILQNAQKREEKDRWKKTVEKLQPILDQQTGGKVRLDKDTPKEAIPSIMQFADGLEKQAREKPLRDLQLQNEQLRQRLSQQEVDAAAAHAAALPEAAQLLATGDARGAMSAYVSKGGRDARTLGELGDLAMQQGKAPAAAPLIFASEKDLEARYPAARFDYSMTPDPTTGRVRVDKISPRAPERSQIPPGYEEDPTKPGAIRPIAGSEGDLKRQEAERTAGNRLQGEVTRADVILTAINQVLPKIDGYTAGFGGTALNKIAGTEAKDVASLIDTIKANIGFEQLQRMREASPTGGALGQIAVRELEYLQAALGNLSTSQSPGKLRQSLGEVQKRYDRWKQAATGTNPDEEKPKATSGASAGGALSADALASKWIKKN